MKLGILAYGLYLLHQPMMGLVFGLAGREAPALGPWPPQWIPLVLMGIVAVTVIGLAHLSWEYFERPLVRRGHHHRYRFSVDTSLVAVAAPAEISNSLLSPASSQDVA